MIAETKARPALSASSFARTWLNRLGPLLGLLLVITIFAALIGDPERYLSPKNLRTVLAQTVIVAIGAIGTDGEVHRRRSQIDCGTRGVIQTLEVVCARVGRAALCG